jgi:nucleotide-binding universal stress UspA family protein
MKIAPVQIKKILYTTDLSDTALHAFSYAVNLATLFNAGITILHVIEDYEMIEPQLSGLLQEEQWKAIQERYIKEARQTLTGKSRDNIIVQEALTQFTANVRAEGQNQPFITDEVLVIFGDPAKKIIETSKDRNCDLIVMGTHGHSLIENILGTTAQKVIRNSRIPVLSVRLKD